HFTLTEDAVKTLASNRPDVTSGLGAEFDTNTKVNPPLRTNEDIKAIEKGLKDGTIDVIASDHAPHIYTEKEVEYENAPFGMIGLQTVFPLVMKQLVDRKVLTLTEAIEKLTINPAKILNIKKGRIQADEDADLTIFDPHKEWRLKPDDIKSLSKNTPFIGWDFKGKVVCVIVGGKVVLSE
ncbi:MAG: amidohydrolase family protein, partial [Candidatus Ratteibacteria bacterium]|nr:amidohydrolase family protein [Candidatus Ratteibacteria bacterium]